MTVKHHHVSMTLVLVIILLILLGVLIKPAFIGYKISKQLSEVGLTASGVIAEIDSLKSQTLVAKTTLASCDSLTKKYLADLQTEKNTSFACFDEKRRLQSDFDLYRREAGANNTVLSVENERIKNTYAAVVQNAANNICCKNRIDSPEIDSYLVASNRIVCASGEEPKINC